MSTSGVIGFEDHDQVIYLYSDGYPSFVVPLIAHSFLDAKDGERPWAEELIEDIMANLEREAIESAAQHGYKYRGFSAQVHPKPANLGANYSVNYEYLVLADGRLISGIDIYNLEELAKTKV